jgi:hypothetical protein
VQLLVKVFRLLLVGVVLQEPAHAFSKLPTSTRSDPATLGVFRSTAFQPLSGHHTFPAISTVRTVRQRILEGRVSKTLTSKNSDPAFPSEVARFILYVTDLHNYLAEAIALGLEQEKFLKLAKRQRDRWAAEKSPGLQKVISIWFEPALSLFLRLHAYQEPKNFSQADWTDVTRYEYLFEWAGGYNASHSTTIFEIAQAARGIDFAVRQVAAGLPEPSFIQDLRHRDALLTEWLDEFHLVLHSKNRKRSLPVIEEIRQRLSPALHSTFVNALEANDEASEDSPYALLVALTLFLLETAKFEATIWAMDGLGGSSRCLRKKSHALVARDVSFIYLLQFCGDGLESSKWELLKGS